MRKVITIILTSILIGCSDGGFILPPFTNAEANKQILTVCVYNNPPFSRWSQENKPEGFFVEVWETLAKKADVLYEYKRGSFAGCLKNVRTGKVDVALAVANTQERRKTIDFVETAAFNNWATVYSRKKLSINSILDLDGKTVAVETDDIYGMEFQRLARNFGANPVLVKAKSYEDVFAQIRDGKVDFGIVSRSFGLNSSTKFGVIRTQVVFFPVQISLAFRTGAYQELMEKMSRNLDALIKDNNSPYHESFMKWMGGARATATSAWMYPAMIITFAAFLLSAVIAYIFRRRSKSQTREISNQEARFRAIFDASSDAIITLKDGYIKECNEAALRLFGCAGRETMSGKSLDDLSPDQQPDGTLSARRAIELANEASKGAALHFEWQHKRLDGELFDADIALSPLELPEGPVLLATIRDISERKAHERQMIETTSLLRTIVENSPAPIMMLDVNYTVKIWNPAAERLYGWTAEEVIGKELPYIDGAERIKVRQKLDQAFISGTSATYESHRKTKDGRDLIVIAESAPVRGVDGEFCGIVGVHVDITDMKKLQSQLLQSQKMDAVGRLAGGIAHDFNNLLTAIFAYATFIVSPDKSTENKHEYARNIIDVADRAAALTRSLLLFSRKQEAEFSRINLHDVVNDFLKLIGRIIGEDIKVTTQLVDKELLILGNAGQLGQVLLNLATNARDAMPKGGTISITASPIEIDESFTTAYGSGVAGRYALLTASDNGYGIPADQLKQIFEPFFTTKDVGKGTGIGLSIVFGIVQAHGGFIDVYSEVDHGTTLKIFIPICDDKSQEAREHFDDKTPTGSETILLVEDNELLHQILSEILSGAGYQVLASRNGAEALEIYRQHSGEVTLILSDVVLPKMNGKELYEATIQIKPDVKFLFLSGYPSDILENRISLEPLADVMYKPVSPVQLLRRVRSVLDN